MRSKILQEILDETPKDVKIFVRMYADIVKRINQILKDKDMSQKELAESLDKKPSEVSRWLNGDHNFTLRSLAKIQAELGEEIISVPRSVGYGHNIHGTTSMTVFKCAANVPKSTTSFSEYSIKQENEYANVS